MTHSMYTFRSRVRYSECDQNSFLRLESIVNYFQDCSTFQSESLGVGIDYLKARQRMWVILTWDIVIDRYANFGEEIEIGTYPYDYDNFFAYRNFFIKSKDEKYLAKGDSKWTLVDTTSGKMARITPQDIGAYRLFDQLEIRKFPRKIERPSLTEQCGEVLVDESFIDSNNHMNNQKYIEIAMRYAPQNMDVSCLRVEYRKSATLGEHIFVNCGKIEDNVTFVLSDGAGRVFSVVQFKSRQSPL